MNRLVAWFRRTFLRLSYEFDRTMSAGPIALIGWLGVATLAVTFIAAAFLHVTKISQPGASPLGFVEAFWEAAMRTIDAGNVGGDTGWDFRLVMLVVTLWGIFVVSALIGLLSAGVQTRLEELRKGRSLVLERDHVIILNWSEAIFDVISELMIAHAKDDRFCIIVLADKDKVEMEDAIAAKIKPPRSVRIVCRSGDPGSLQDLAIANPAQSKSIIVLSQGGEDPDSQNIKIVLALVHGPGRRSEPYSIAVEFCDASNADVAQAIGGSEVQTVLADDLISRIIVQTGRQVGLSAVYLELLDFKGSETYVLPRPELAGMSYGEAVLKFERGALIGFCTAEGGVMLNPPAETRVEPGALAILVAEDRDSVVANETGAANTAQICLGARPPRGGESVLVLGWNRRGPEIVRQMISYMAPGSRIMIAGQSPKIEKAIAALESNSRSVVLEVRQVETRNRAELEALEPSRFDHVLVLAQTDHGHAQAADTSTLVTLLHLRKIAERDNAHFTVVSEIADVRNRELADVTQADDFVVSHRLVSLMLAQAAENKFASAIFRDLLSAEGSELYMRPAASFVPLDEPVDFYTIVEAALQRGETAIGYCQKARGSGGVVINPNKSEKIEYREGDLIVVLAED